MFFWLYGVSYGHSRAVVFTAVLILHQWSHQVLIFQANTMLLDACSHILVTFLVMTNFLFTFLLAVPFIHTSDLFMWFSLSRVCSLIAEYYGSHSWLWVKSLVFEHSLFKSRTFELLTRIRVRHNTKGRVSVREQESSRCWCSSPAITIQ